MNKKNIGKILVVDDEKPAADAFAEILEDEGYSVECAYRGKDALLKIEEDSDFFLIITDLRLGDISGIDLIKKIKEVNSDASVIMITAYGTVTNAVDAMKAGIDDYMTKPVDFEKLKISVNNLAKRTALLKENIYLKTKIRKSYSFENIIGKSRKMLDVFNTIEKVAKTNSTVLLRGETGSGKGLIARAIHFNSPRKDKPLIEINCGALPDTLLENELFGCKKGAFTGADADRKGKFEEADGGTVLLDEIGDISINFQAKLLKAIQDKIFEPLGSNIPVKLNARVIASTNRNLEAAIEEKSFREDLYYRLNVVPVYVPPLRDRKEDAPLLINYFSNKYSKENNLPVKIFPPEVVEALQEYSWPGNVRELENFIERIIVMSDRKKEIISLEDIYALKKGLMLKKDIEVGDLKALLEIYEKKIIQKALALNENNKTRAAFVLNISLRQLHYKIEKYNL